MTEFNQQFLSAISSKDRLKAHDVFKVAAKQMEGGSFRGYVTHCLKCVFSLSYRTDLAEKRNSMLNLLKEQNGVNSESENKVKISIAKGQRRKFHKLMRKLIETIGEPPQIGGNTENYASGATRVASADVDIMTQHIDVGQVMDCLSLRRLGVGGGAVFMVRPLSNDDFCADVQEMIEHKVNKLYASEFGEDEESKVADLKPLCKMTVTCDDEEIAKAIFEQADISENEKIITNLNAEVMLENVNIRVGFYKNIPTSNGSSELPRLAFDNYELSVRVPSRKLMQAYVELDRSVKNDSGGAANSDTDGLERLFRQKLNGSDNLGLTEAQRKWLVRSYAECYGCDVR